MNLQENRVALYINQSVSGQKILQEFLSGIGYVVTAKLDTIEQLKKMEFDDSYCVFIFLLTDVEQIQILTKEILRINRLLPVIGLFAYDEALWDLYLISACHEISTWPCNKQELNYRLQNITDNKPPLDMEQSFFVGRNIIGNSPAFLEVLNKVKKISTCDVPVLIDGETGTGKELIAKAIHYLSWRKDGPFIATNCGALPDQLIENELFGHDKGAYTDAYQSNDGLIAQAEGGTLFLDEIETLTHKGQIVLLRFLDGMEYRPLGCNKSKTANIRVVIATNQNISEMVEKGQFRKDLFFRINIMNIQLPPLRDRSGDLKILAQHFIRLYQIQYDQPKRKLDPNTLEELKYYDWPGNVRELENILHREFLLANTNTVYIEQVESARQERRNKKIDRRLQNSLSEPMVTAKKKLVSDFEQHYLCSALQRAQGNISEAARLAGKERRSFTRLLEKHHLIHSESKTYG